MLSVGIRVLISNQQLRSMSPAEAVSLWLHFPVNVPASCR